MQYLLLIYEEEKRYEGRSLEEMGGEMNEYIAYGQELAGAIKACAPLQTTSAATTVRVREGRRLVTDGPFAETKEQLGGVYLVEAKDLDEAIDMAAKIPGVRFGCVEVRPIMTFS